jgi:hypothetical protein
MLLANDVAVKGLSCFDAGSQVSMWRVGPTRREGRGQNGICGVRSKEQRDVAGMGT